MTGRWQPFVLLSLIVVVLVGCAAPVASAPQVLVTRIPLDVTNSAPLRVTALPDIAEPAVLLPGNATLPLTRTQALTATQPLTQASAGAGALPVPDVTPAPVAVVDPSLRPLQQTRNILLLGTDQRDLGALGRTDTIMVLAVDAPNNRVALVSFPRDTYLPIPGVGYSRINTAYPYGEERQVGGGLPLLMSTIEKNFGIPIERYVRIDFSGFKDVIDALGGVDVVVDCPLYDELIYRYFQTYTLEPGTYHMNGEQALYYSRSRKTTSDFDRARRQQRVLLAVRKRVLDGNLLPRIPALWLAMRDIVDTNLNPADIAELASLGSSLESKDLYGMVIRYPLLTDWVTPQGGMVQLPDLPGINQALDNIWQRQPLQETNNEERVCP